MGRACRLGPRGTRPLGVTPVVLGLCWRKHVGFARPSCAASELFAQDLCCSHGAGWSDGILGALGSFVSAASPVLLWQSPLQRPPLQGTWGSWSGTEALPTAGASKRLPVPLLSRVYGDFLVGLGILFGFPAAKEQRRGKGGRRNSGAASAQGVKVSLQLKSVRLP